MELRFYVDPETGEPHIHAHRVSEQEVEEALYEVLEDRPGRDATRVAYGATRGGRLLRIVYVLDSQDEAVFVITAFPPGLKSAWALRRRLKRKGSKA